MTIEEIAKDILGMKTLKTMLNDDQDFHTLSTWQIKKTLSAAYYAGQKKS